MALWQRGIENDGGEKSYFYMDGWNLEAHKKYKVDGENNALYQQHFAVGS